MMEFAAMLLKDRFYLRMTQEQYAKHLKVPYQTYVGWERGRNLPSLKSLDRLISRTMLSRLAAQEAYMKDKLKGRIQ